MDIHVASILVIDQSKPVFDQVQQVLSLIEKPPALVYKSSVSDALAYLQENTPDIIICDYFLGDGNADLLLNHSLIEQKIPVIILTEKGNEKLAVEAIKNGAVDFLASSSESIASLPRTLKKNHREWCELQQQRQAENDRLANQARLADAQEIAQLGNWKWNLATNNIYCSDEMFVILGIARTEFTNGFDDIVNFIHTEDREMVTLTINNVIENCMPFELEFRIIQPQSKVVMVRSQGKPTLNERGDISHITGITQDISRSYETQKQLNLLASALEASADSIVITDIDGQIVWANPAMTRLSGYKYTELVGETPNLWHSLNQNKLLFDELWETILSGKTWQGELINRKKNGEEYLEEQTITSVLNERGEISHFVAIKRDISARKEIEAKNLQAAQVFEHSIEGIVICDANNTIIRVNPAFSKITGYNEHEIIGKKPNILNSGKHDKKFFAGLWNDLNTKGVWQGEIWNRRKNGETYPEFLTISTLRDPQGHIIEYIAIFADISDRKQDEEHIHRLAYYDKLTNLPNRTLIQEVLKKALTLRNDDDEDLVGILNIDIDRFFTINETMGHEAGDQLLQIIARRITRCNDEMDKTARISSDEFTIICPNIDSPNTLSKKAQRLLESIAEPIKLNQQEVFVTASIGIAIAPGDGDNEAILFRNAESARNHAKREGNSFQFFNDEMNTQGFEQLVMKSSLRRALERNEFQLYYQPQIDIMTGQIVGAESLIRWLHPDLGLVSPNRFIPILEETGLIAEVGKWVLETACRQNKQWQEAGHKPIQIAVNLSPRQFRQKDLIITIQSILEKTGLDAQWLELEVTESSIMDNPEEVVETLNSLHNLGIKLSIDDFGTGYSSLNYLKTFPIDVLKIDRSFIRDITFDKDDEIIVKTIIAMGHNLGLKIIAEGVEDNEQLELVKKYQCEWFQGFYFSQPLSVEAFTELLSKQNPPADKAHLAG